MSIVMQEHVTAVWLNNVFLQWSSGTDQALASLTILVIY